MSQNSKNELSEANGDDLEAESSPPEHNQALLEQIKGWNMKDYSKEWKKLPKSLKQKEDSDSFGESMNKFYASSYKDDERMS